MKIFKKSRKLKMLPLKQQAFIANAITGGCQVGDCCDIQPNNPWCIFKGHKPPVP